MPSLSSRSSSAPTVLVVVDHRVVVLGLPAAGLADGCAASTCVRRCMCVVLNQTKNGLPPVVLALDEVDRAVDDLVVDRLHPLLRQRARCPRSSACRSCVTRAVDHAAGPEPLAEVREVGRGRDSRAAPAPPRRSGGRGCRRTRRTRAPSAGARPCRRGGSCRTGPSRTRAASAARRSSGPRPRIPRSAPGSPTLLRPGAVHALTGDERRSSRGAALLAVRVGESHSLGRDPVDVGRPVAHHPVAVAAQVRDADVVSPDDEDVRFLRSATNVPPPGL